MAGTGAPAQESQVARAFILFGFRSIGVTFFVWRVILHRRQAHRCALDKIIRCPVIARGAHSSYAETALHHWRPEQRLRRSTTTTNEPFASLSLSTFFSAFLPRIFVFFVFYSARLRRRVYKHARWARDRIEREKNKREKKWCSRDNRLGSSHCGRRRFARSLARPAHTFIYISRYFLFILFLWHFWTIRSLLIPLSRHFFFFLTLYSVLVF